MLTIVSDGVRALQEAAPWFDTTLLRSSHATLLCIDLPFLSCLRALFDG
jgi:hypothetical protein